MDKVKMVILVNMRLKMKCGKIASQSCHASNMAIENLKKKNIKLYNIWKFTGQKTVVVKADNEEQFLDIKQKLDNLKINNVIVNDMGLTQIAPGSITTMGIGPFYEKIIDQVTGDLKLL